MKQKRHQCLFLAIFLFTQTGCRLVGWNVQGFSHAWDDFRCDRRVAVFVNLRLDTTAYAGEAREKGSGVPVASAKDQFIHPTTTTRNYNSALAYLYSKKIDEVIFSGRTTAHGTIAEFRALNDGFSSIPDPAYRSGHATIAWTVPRTYHFAPEDAQGKYHPRTFWPRVFGTEWTDTYIAFSRTARALTSSDAEHAIFLISRYGSRRHIRQLAYLAREIGDGDSKKTISGWETIREWDAHEENERLDNR